MYPVFKADAEFQKEKAAFQSLDYALESEKVHAKMYEKAKEAVLAEKDIEVKDIYVCPTCGYTMEGTAPDKCPICGARKDTFAKF